MLVFILSKEIDYFTMRLCAKREKKRKVVSR